MILIFCCFSWRSENIYYPPMNDHLSMMSILPLFLYLHQLILDVLTIHMKYHHKIYEHLMENISEDPSPSESSQLSEEK